MYSSFNHPFLFSSSNGVLASPLGHIKWYRPLGCKFARGSDWKKRAALWSRPRSRVDLQNGPKAMLWSGAVWKTRSHDTETYIMLYFLGRIRITRLCYPVSINRYTVIFFIWISHLISFSLRYTLGSENENRIALV